jgi:hypothetical protein
MVDHSLANHTQVPQLKSFNAAVVCGFDLRPSFDTDGSRIENSGSFFSQFYRQDNYQIPTCQNLRRPEDEFIV